MVFTKDSALVKIWYGAILTNQYTLDHVPKLSNLKEVVTELVNEVTA